MLQVKPKFVVVSRILLRSFSLAYFPLVFPRHLSLIGFDHLRRSHVTQTSRVTWPFQWAWQPTSPPMSSAVMPFQWKDPRKGFTRFEIQRRRCVPQLRSRRKGGKGREVGGKEWLKGVRMLREYSLAISSRLSGSCNFPGCSQIILLVPGSCSPLIRVVRPLSRAFAWFQEIGSISSPTEHFTSSSFVPRN